MDALGPVIAVDVLAATVHDHTAGTALPGEVAENADGTVGKALADRGLGPRSSHAEKTQVMTD